MSRRSLVGFAIFIAILLIPLTIYFAPEFAAFIWDVVVFLTPIWLPLLLFSIAVPLWFSFARARFVAAVPFVTLELKPGPETPLSARAMELVFYSLYHRIDITPSRAFFFGESRPAYSFEAYGHDGRVRFFVHIPAHHRTLLESRIRAEYRDIDIHEARDYSREVHFDPFHTRVLVNEYTLSKPDPYPLKTYIAYEEPPQKRDVFSEVAEVIAGAGPEEHIFFSVMVRPHQRERKGFFDDPTDSLHQDAQKEIAKITGSKGEISGLPPPAKKLIASIEAALRKPSFDCGVRALYVSRNEHFDKTYEAKLSALLDPFNDPDYNGFVAYTPEEHLGFFLSELFTAVPTLTAEHLIRLYRRRAFFGPQYTGRAFVLNTEELATLFHVPHAGRGSALARMHGNALLPPENLPL